VVLRVLPVSVLVETEPRSRRRHAAVTAYCYCCGSGREVLKAGVTNLRTCIILVRLQVIIEVSVKITIFWVVKPYCLAEYIRFSEERPAEIFSVELL